MSDDLQREAFEPHVGEPFQVETGDGAVYEMRLEKVQDLSARMRLPEGFREPFSLSLRAEPGFELPQGTYWVSREDVGRFPMFVVPVITPDLDKGRIFEITIS